MLIHFNESELIGIDRIEVFQINARILIGTDRRRALIEEVLTLVYRPGILFQIKDQVFNGVPVRVFEKVNRIENSPALIWIHGGGWITGSAGIV